MKFVYLALPLLGSLAIAQSLTEDNCQCPQVKCPSTDTFVSILQLQNDTSADIYYRKAADASTLQS